MSVDADSKSPEARAAPRRRALKAGVIAFQGHFISYRCTVREISDTGAKLRVDDVFLIPDNFDLLIELDAVEYSCSVVWRRQNELGVRFYTPRVTVAPRRESFAFCLLRFADKPGIRVRNDFYFEAFDPIWAAHNRGNGAMGTRVQPGGVEGYCAVHTFYPLLPPEEFFEAYTEWYSLIDGKRTYDRAQLCLTNPEVLDKLTERLKERMRENPDNLIYCVSQNDWHGACQCDNCQAIATREESEAGPVVWFVNQVAERIEKEFPDKYVGTLAY